MSDVAESPVSSVEGSADVGECYYVVVYPVDAVEVPCDDTVGSL